MQVRTLAGRTCIWTVGDNQGPLFLPLVLRVRSRIDRRIPRSGRLPHPASLGTTNQRNTKRNADQRHASEVGSHFRAPTTVNDVVARLDSRYGSYPTEGNHLPSLPGDEVAWV
jgi:hypothetical protein